MKLFKVLVQKRKISVLGADEMKFCSLKMNLNRACELSVAKQLQFNNTFPIMDVPQ